ncbi:MAG: GerMN domain-containing protein [Acidimicrobiales bacterium]
MRGRVARRASVGAALALATVSAACGIPSGGAPTDIAKANVPFHLLNPAPSTTVPTPPAVGVTETIFLVVGGQHLQPVTRDVPVPANLTQILGALLDGPTAAESSAGLQTFLTSTHIQVTASVSNGIATVNFASNPVQVVGPDQTLAVAQVVFTATQQPGVAAVAFEIAGQPIGVPTSSGVQASGPVNRILYAPVAPLS